MEKYPGRFFDVGMAEQHAVTFAAGLAVQGLRPVVAVYSTFLQRAYDQIFHDVCLQDLPVVFALDHAGLVSKYGQTHQGILDIAYLRHLPNIILLSPRDTVELEMMLEYAFTLSHPVAIRYPADSDAGAVKTGARPPLEHATAEILCGGKDIAIWAVGTTAGEALKAARILQQNNINARVINVRFVKPLDESTLLRCVDDGITRYFTVEDHLLSGGFGSLFLETANKLRIDAANVTTIGVEHSFIPSDTRTALLKDFGLNGEAIALRVQKEMLSSKSAGVEPKG
jgi:1-deoxy-D-xylulose-5-phosphate synthase